MSNDTSKELDPSETQTKSGMIGRFLNFIEVTGNKLPDPAVLFLLLMALVWGSVWDSGNQAASW